MTFSHSTLVRLAGNAMIEMFRHADGFDARLTRGTWCVASGAGHPVLNWIAVFEPGASAVIAFREAVLSLRSPCRDDLISQFSECADGRHVDTIVAIVAVNQHRSHTDAERPHHV